MNKELSKLAAAFGPPMMTMGLLGSTGSFVDVLLAAAGSLLMSWSLISAIENKEEKKPYIKNHWF